MQHYKIGDRVRTTKLAEVDDQENPFLPVGSEATVTQYFNGNEELPLCLFDEKEARERGPFPMNLDGTPYDVTFEVIKD
jgi:hypothetical protein